MTLRAAGAADMPAVAELERELFGADAWSADQVTEELLGERRQAWVVGEPVVGYVVTMTLGDVCDLHRIAVHPGHRRRGLAHVLLSTALAASTEAGRMLLEVSAANRGAVAFYEAHGFAEVDRRRRYYRDGSDAVVMSRPMTAPVAEAGRRERMDP